ncbi:transmembrane protease serine 2-like, partial [Anneissia japonica]|uniref:transmembrane protease serine 2-like n=1 Tax=Anneissia japonica TaxID=1529436 RepID=UPI001425A03C
CSYNFLFYYSFNSIGSNIEQIEVWLGSIYAVNPDSQTLVRRNISKIVSHPKFSYINDDYALIRLSEPVIFTDAIKPVCLPTSDMTFEPGSYGYTTGWGSVIMYGNSPDVLQEVRVVVISLEYCRRRVHFANVTADMICLKDRNGGQGPCHGDSGGPFVVNRDGRWYLVGVVTGGRTCAGRRDPTIYARVSRFLDFTYYTIWEHALAVIPIS